MNKVVLICLTLLALCVAVQGQNQISTSIQDRNDVNTLNYALTLEHLEAAFYVQGQNTFNVTAFTNAGLPSSAYAYVSLIRDHELAHVALLSGALGSQAVPACTYNFTYAMSSVYAYIATARLLEETGVSAYDGAANSINNAGLLQTAATIATIEARHASYLNQLLSYIALQNTTGQPSYNFSSTVNQTYPYSPFPMSFDMAISPANVLAAAGVFITSCPSSGNPNSTLPTPAYVFTPYNFTNLNNVSFVNSSGQYLTTAQFNNDNLVLNYSLTLELLGNAFYQAASAFTPAQFVAAGYSYADYNNFQMIAAHEAAHVAFLNGALTARGATPAVACNYNLGQFTANVSAALSFARVLTNLEVTAYDGAINRLTQFDLIQGAATIATVEARHGNYMNNLLNGTGVQTANVDSTMTPDQILAMTSSFFGSNCVAPTVPVQAYTLQAQYLAAYNNNTVVNGTARPSESPFYGYTGSSSSLKSFLSLFL